MIPNVNERCVVAVIIKISEKFWREKKYPSDLLFPAQPFQWIALQNAFCPYATYSTLDLQYETWSSERQL